MGAGWAVLSLAGLWGWENVGEMVMARSGRREMDFILEELFASPEGGEHCVEDFKYSAIEKLIRVQRGRRFGMTEPGPRLYTDFVTVRKPAQVTVTSV